MLYFCVSLSAIAGGVSSNNTPSPLLIITPPEFNEIQAGDDEFLSGMILPGVQYESEGGWWAFSCNFFEGEGDHSCKITNTSLTVKPHSLSLNAICLGEEEAVGQLLHWHPRPARGTLLMIRPVASTFVKLALGPVPTYYPSMDSNIFTKGASQYQAGVSEAELDMPNGIKARLLPVIVLPGNTRPATGSQMLGRHTLELRIGSKHQTLISNNFDLFSQDYLLWAGDMDGDGRLDLLINANEDTKKSVLYLSSLAKNNDLVGEAGSFEQQPPKEFAC